MVSKKDMGRPVTIEPHDLSKYVFAGLSFDQATKYATRLRDHIHFVRQCGEALGVAQQLLDKHDDSKWSPTQFVAYARKFFPEPEDEADPVFIETQYQFARLTHIHLEPHHWQHWVIPGGGKNGNLVTYMPAWYALEMVADWQAASIFCIGQKEMGEWLTENVPKIVVHSATAQYLEVVLREHGYDDVMDKVSFAKAEER